ncbi:MAG: HAMP domain-containing sensor histidine kinase [Clostridia bacterium]
MDKIKSAWKWLKAKAGIRGAFVRYTAIAIITGLVLLSLTFVVIDDNDVNVAFHIIESEEDMDRINQEDNQLVEFIIDYSNLENAFFDNVFVFYARNITVILLLIFYLVSTVALASVAFYIRKIKKPLKLIQDGSEQISKKSLDFSVDYDEPDEMGELCKSFETMRASLQENNLKMWNLVDEQRRIHDAFSHDIRTPLTVLCGYNDLLLERIPEGKIDEEMLMKTLHLMKDNLIRVENFITSMSKLQKLSDLTPDYYEVELEGAYQMLKENTLMACTEKRVVFHGETDATKAILAVDFIKQVLMNLVNNAKRFAKEEVAVTCSVKDGLVTINVQDDGDGFSKKALEQAKTAYYSESNDHFGLGLHICTIICDKIDGQLRISNTETGALVTFTCPVTTQEEHIEQIGKYYR